MMILLIALIPAVVVFFIAVGTGSKVKTTFSALIAAALGVITGNPIYMALDVAAVGLRLLASDERGVGCAQPATTSRYSRSCPKARRQRVRFRVVFNSACHRSSRVFCLPVSELWQQPQDPESAAATSTSAASSYRAAALCCTTVGITPTTGNGQKKSKANTEIATATLPGDQVRRQDGGVSDPAGLT